MLQWREGNEHGIRECVTLLAEGRRKREFAIKAEAAAIVLGWLFFPVCFSVIYGSECVFAEL